MLYQINAETSEKINDFFRQAKREQTRRNSHGTYGVHESDIAKIASELKGPNKIISDELNDNAHVLRYNTINNWECAFMAGDLAVHFKPDPLGSDSITIITKDGTMYRFNTWHNGYEISTLERRYTYIRVCSLTDIDKAVLEFCGYTLNDILKFKKNFPCQCPYVNSQKYTTVSSQTDCQFCKDTQIG